MNTISLNHISIPGLQVHDTCNSEELTQKHLYHIISTTREAASVLKLKAPVGPPLLGMIGIGEPATLTETTGALHAFNIPLISVTPHPKGPSYSNVLTTAPDMAGQARVRHKRSPQTEPLTLTSWLLSSWFLCLVTVRRWAAWKSWSFWYRFLIAFGCVPRFYVKTWRDIRAKQFFFFPPIYILWVGSFLYE